MQPEGEGPAKIDLPAILSGELLTPTGDRVAAETALADKLVGLYFSASWCPPCRAFTPVLVDFHKAHADEFEVILISSDHNQADQDAYVKKYGMTWLALPNRSQEVDRLSEAFNVTGIPHLVITAPDGTVLSTDGRGDITRLGQDALSAWKQISSSP